MATHGYTLHNSSRYLTVSSERGTDEQEITIPIVDIPLTVPIPSSPTRQLLLLLKQFHYLRGTWRLKDYTM